MNANAWQAVSDRFGETVDAMIRVRRLVLDLAVSGRLVSQSPADEPSRELLHWMGDADLPPRWARASLGDLLVFRYGRPLPVRDRSQDGPIPVYGSNGIVGYTERALSVRPCVIVGRKGSAGALNMCVGPSWTTDVGTLWKYLTFS